MSTLAGSVWVFAEQGQGRYRRVAWEAIGLAQKLAGEHGKKLVIVTLGSDAALAAQLGEKQADEVIAVVDPALAHPYNADAYVAAFRALAKEGTPFMVVAGHTYQCFDFLPRLAAGMKGALASEVTAWNGGLAFQRPLFGGKLTGQVTITGAPPYFVTCQAGAFSAEAAAAGKAPVREVAAGIDAASLRRTVVEIVSGAKDQVDLSKAERIVAVGRGIGAEDKMALVRDLAAALGAEIGASRPVVDSGWLPRDRQIGSSGQTVAPRLYVALGISGAIQHVTGMKNAGCIVAINKDADAPIFNDATYGIVGDLFEVVPPFIELVKQGKESR